MAGPQLNACLRRLTVTVTTVRRTGTVRPSLAPGLKRHGRHFAALDDICEPLAIARHHTGKTTTPDIPTPRRGYAELPYAIFRGFAGTDGGTNPLRRLNSQAQVERLLRVYESPLAAG